jgi:hypothetical protein
MSPRWTVYGFDGSGEEDGSNANTKGIDFHLWAHFEEASFLQSDNDDEEEEEEEEEEVSNVPTACSVVCQRE